MNIEEIALRLIESDCNTDYYFKILNELENHTTKIQELEKEKAHIEIAYEEDYKEQQQEIEKLTNIINKTIESVQEHYDNSYSTDDVNDIGSGTYDDLMEILKGVDKG